MISIVALINVIEWIKDGDNYKNIEESISSVVKQTYKKWELRIVLYGYGNILNDNDNDNDISDKPLNEGVS